MNFRTIGVVILCLAASACGGAQDPPKSAGGATRPAPQEKPDPLANALVFKCEDGEQLRVDLESRDGSAIVQLGDNPAATLPLDKTSDVQSYSDGTITLGMGGGSEVAFAHAPDAPLACHHVSKSLPAPKAPGVSRTFTAEDQGKSITMTVGEKIAISLVGVPTAGYVWSADKAPDFVKITEGPSGPTVSDQKLPGYTGGNHWEVLVVEALKPGSGKLALAMRRPWEKTREPDAPTFSVNLSVK